MPDRRAEIVRLATEVMGWRVYTSGRGSIVACSPEDEDDRILFTTHPWESAEWNPYTSWSDAGMLAEALQKEGHWFFIETVDIQTWASSVIRPYPAKPIRMEGATAPEAICNAAIALLDARKEEGKA